MPERLMPSQQQEIRAERPCPKCGGQMTVRYVWQEERGYKDRYLVCGNKNCGHREPVR